MKRATEGITKIALYLIVFIGFLICGIDCRDTVDDDYCDLGEDEPNTPACSHISSARFTCRSGVPPYQSITSSRVWDDVCDCCDGSDEKHPTRCPQTCDNERGKAVLEAQDEYNTARKGYELRMSMVANATRSLWEWDARLNGIGSEEDLDTLKSLRTRLKLLLVSEERDEYRTRIERARSCKPGPNSRKKCPVAEVPLVKKGERSTKPLNAKEAAVEIGKLKWMKDGKGRILTMTDYLEHRAAGAQKSDAEKLRDIEKTTLFAGRALNDDKRASRNALSLMMILAGIILTPVRVTEYLLEKAVNISMNGLMACIGALGSYYGNKDISQVSTIYQNEGVLGLLPPYLDYRQYSTLRIAQARVQFWLRRNFQRLWDSPFELYDFLFPRLDMTYESPGAALLREGILLCENTLEVATNIHSRASVDEGSKRLTPTDTLSLEKLTSCDWGKQSVYASLAGSCWSLQEGQYNYKLCIPHEAKQSATTLGQWGRWDESGTRMTMVDGSRCGSKAGFRTTSIITHCATSTYLESVSEPEICTYVMHLATPAACSFDVLRKAEARLRDLGVTVD